MITSRVHLIFEALKEKSKLSPDYIGSQVETDDRSDYRSLSPALVDHYQKHQRSLPRDYAYGLTKYKGGFIHGQPANEVLNSALRSKTSRVRNPETAELDRQIHGSMAPIPEGHDVWRGIYSPDVTSARRAARKGDVIHNKSYTSTTLNPHTAERLSYGGEDVGPDSSRPAPPAFLKDSGNKNLRVNTVEHIHLPKGTRAHYLDIDFHSKKSNDRSVLDNLGQEREVLLDKGTKFKVLGHSFHKTMYPDSTTGYTHVIHMEAIPSDH